jgi:hypothetical protein
MTDIEHDLLKIRNATGEPLRSEILVLRESEDRATLVLKANGGNPPLNPDYNGALEEILRRSLDNGYALESVRVVSSTADQYPDVDPEIDIGGYPVVAGRDDVPELRTRIQSAVAKKFQRPDARGSGNRQKKIELEFSSLSRGRQLRTVLSTEQLGRTASVGTDYEADEDVVVTIRNGELSLDAATREEGLRRHATAQNSLRRFVLENGFVQVRATSNVDLAWSERDSLDEELWIAEVKGLTEDNERGQLRLGLGQIIDFVDEDVSRGRQVRGVLFVSQPPRNERWTEKCARAGIILAWPGNWPSRSSSRSEI